MSTSRSRQPSLSIKPAVPEKPSKLKQMQMQSNSRSVSTNLSVRERQKKLERELNLTDVLQRMILSQGTVTPKTGGESGSSTRNNEQRKDKNITNPGSNGFSPSVNNEQRNKRIANPGTDGFESECCRFERNRGDQPSRTRSDKDSIGVVAEPVKKKNQRQVVEVIGKDGHNLEDPTKTSCTFVKKPPLDDGDVLICSPVLMLMRQLEDSVEMPMVNFSRVLETELEDLLSYRNEDIEHSRIHFISEWNGKVNQLLVTSDYSLSSDFYRNVASLILSKLDSDFDAALMCLSNERVKLIVAQYASELEQTGRRADSTLSDNRCNKKSMNRDIWNAAIEGVIASARERIEQKCRICLEALPPDKIFAQSVCQCVVCNPCTKEYFLEKIHGGDVADFVCPVCRVPDVEDVVDATLHFQLLEQRLKTLLPAKDFATYQRKMTDWNLGRNPNFLWCINTYCRNGFVIEENSYKRAVCPVCGTKMCHKCKKPWEEQHEGVTCEMFKEWKESTDPQFEESELTQQLLENGIDCPRCKRRYLISKGGCIHYTCTHCHHEFCSSCSRPFVRNCKTSDECKQSSGLHCHHPRNCLYYLRDKSVGELQRLLNSNNLSYNTFMLTSVTSCPIPEEQDVGTGCTSELCGKSILPGHAGLCEKHYKEYLAGIIRKHGIDSAEIMSQSELIRELQNSGIIDVPKKQKSETPEQYQCRLAQLVRETEMLPKRH